MTYGELKRTLRRLGFIPLTHGKNHDYWGTHNASLRTLIPRHRGEVPTGTLHSILRSLNLTLDDLRKRR
ncbi:MAG: type II toxin-antitoxin system HicA family toxin [Dehalococcoidia bacterium]